MRKLTLNELENYSANGDGQDFIAGFMCAAGLFTITTGVGAALAIVGCGSAFGDW